MLLHFETLLKPYEIEPGASLASFHPDRSVHCPVPNRKSTKTDEVLRRWLTTSPRSQLHWLRRLRMRPRKSTPKCGWGLER